MMKQKKKRKKKLNRSFFSKCYISLSIFFFLKSNF